MDRHELAAATATAATATAARAAKASRLGRLREHLRKISSPALLEHAHHVRVERLALHAFTKGFEHAGNRLLVEGLHERLAIL